MSGSSGGLSEVKIAKNENTELRKHSQKLNGTAPKERGFFQAKVGVFSFPRADGEKVACLFPVLSVRLFLTNKELSLRANGISGKTRCGALPRDRQDEKSQSNVGS
jgi:hypothetical protein